MLVLTIITEQETDHIYRLNRRVSALQELDFILNPNSAEDIQIQENIKLNLKTCKERKQDWWNKIVEKYNLPYDKELIIIYDTNEIIESDKCENC